MNELTKRAKLLRAQIEKAFADVLYPGDENLYDSWQLDDDYEDVIKNLTGKHWREITPTRKPPKGRSSRLQKDLTFCSPAAWHFFLPAHLIAEMMRGEISLYPFEPARSESLKDHIERRYSRLNTEQCAAVISFLDYADALLVEKLKKTPQHSAYFERRRQQLARVIVYWNKRALLTAKMEVKPAG